MEIARNQHWYRIPVDSAEKLLKQYWAPKWIAFYQTKVFSDEAFSIYYYARILNIQTVARTELFPDETHSEKATKQYYKLELAPLQELPQPIVNVRKRRITFIPTTLVKLTTAVDLNDLS